MKNIFYSILICVFFIGCEKQAEWPLQSERQKLIIVDGTITDEKKTQIITLTFSVDQLNEAPSPVTGASVIISDEDSVYNLTEQTSNPGRYETSNFFQGHAGKHYTLLISYKNNIYTAKTRLPAGFIFNPLHYTEDNNSGLYRITWVANAYNDDRFAMWEILLDWSKVQGYQNTNPDSCKARLLYYTLPTLDVSQIFAPESEKILFPEGTLITERRYSLTREHAEFIRALLSETKWQGGMFDSEHANVPTNLNEGAAGFFGACAVTSLSLTVTK